MTEKNRSERLLARLDAVLGYGEPSPRERALQTLLDGEAGSAGEAVRWLREVKTLFHEADALGLQREALQNPAFRKHVSKGAFIRELLPDVSACAALLSRPVPAASLKAAKELLHGWVSRELPELRKRLAGYGMAAGRTWDASKTIRRNLGRYDPESRRLGVSRIHFRPKRSELPPHVLILLDRSASMGEDALWTALCACALHGFPETDTRLFCFAEELRDLSALCDDPVELLLTLPTGGMTNLSGALAALGSRITAPSRSVLFLLSDLRSEPVEAEKQAAALMDGGLELRLVLPPDDAAYDRALAARLLARGAKSAGDILPLPVFAGGS